MVLRALLLLSLLCAAPAAEGQGVDARPEADEAQVVFHGHRIAVLRATLFGHPPDERAVLATRRLVEVAGAGGPGVVATRQTGDGALLTVDGSAVLLLVPDDADRLLGETLEDAVGQAGKTLGTVLLDEHQPISGDRLTASLLRVLVVTLLFAAVVAAVLLLRGLGTRLIVRLAHGSAKGLHNRDLAAFIQDQLVRTLKAVLLLGAWTVGVLAGYLWLAACLDAFPLTRDLGEQLGGRLGGLVLGIVRGVGRAIPDLTVVAGIVVATGVVAHMVKLFFARIEHRGLNMGWLNRYTAVPTRRLTTVVLWLFALAMAYPYLPGSNSDAFKGLSVLVGVMVSLGGASLVGQAASGFILTYLGTIRVGDYVIVGQVEGEVAEIGIFTTRLNTVFKEAVSIPNVFILSNTITNLSRFPGSDGVVVQATVTIGYATPWREVHGLLLEAAGRTSGIRQSPAPYVQQRALSDFYPEYHLCVHLERPAERIAVLSDLHSSIQDVFNEHGVQIMSPHYMQDPAHPAVVPRERWLPRPDGPDQSTAGTAADQPAV